MGATLYSILIDFLFFIPMAITLMRLVFPLVRAPFSDPAVSWTYTVTNPLMRPLERVVPRYRNFHIAALLLFLLTAMLNVWASTLQLDPALIVIGGLVKALWFAFGAFFLMMLLYILASFVVLRQGNFLIDLVNRIAAPPCRAVRRVIPPLGPFDLSPALVIMGSYIVVLIVSQLLMALLG